MVTSKGAVSLHDALVPLYAKAGVDDRLQLDIPPAMAHDWTDEATVQRLRSQIGAWYGRYL